METTDEKSLREKYRPGSIAVCPHCNRESRLESLAVIQYSPFSDTTAVPITEIVIDKMQFWGAECSLCRRSIIGITYQVKSEHGEQSHERLMWPASLNKPVPNGVPDSIARDYREACEVLNLSPRASAALSRRCLEALLPEKAGTTKKWLADQIDDVLTKNELPLRLTKGLEIIRKIGVLAAHVKKCVTTGEIVDVEENEALLTLNIFEQLLEYFYLILPTEEKQIRELEAKIARTKQ